MPGPGLDARASTQGRSRFSPALTSVDRPRRWWLPAPGPSGDYASSCGSGSGLGQRHSDRVAVVRVHTRACTVKDRERYEQKSTSFRTLNRQCLRWHPVASVIDRYWTPAPTSRQRAEWDGRRRKARVRSPWRLRQVVRRAVLPGGDPHTLRGQLVYRRATKRSKLLDQVEVGARAAFSSHQPEWWSS